MVVNIELSKTIVNVAISSLLLSAQGETEAQSLIENIKDSVNEENVTLNLEVVGDDAYQLKLALAILAINQLIRKGKS